MQNQSTQIALKLPFISPSSPSSPPSPLCTPCLHDLQSLPSHIQLPTHPQITLSKKRTFRPLFSATISQYRNKQDGEIVEVVDEVREIGVLYQCVRMGDFWLRVDGKEDSLDDLKQLLKDKILNETTLNYTFLSPPHSFLKPFNLPLTSTNLLVNKTLQSQPQSLISSIPASKSKPIRSHNISFTEPIPTLTSITIPNHVTKSKIYNIVKEYLEKRPCWLRNVLQYQLWMDGYCNLGYRYGDEQANGKQGKQGKQERIGYTTNQLKNILKYHCYTFRDGPWKHVFCRLGYDPRIHKQAALYQILILKLKKKQVQDYQQQQQSHSQSQIPNLYNPTLAPTVQRNPPFPSPSPSVLVSSSNKFLRMYQLCDISDRGLEQLINSTAMLGVSCGKEYGWFNRGQYQQILGIVRRMRDE